MSDFHTIKTKWPRDRKKACMEKDKRRGSIGAVGQMILAVWGTCLTLPVALNCLARQCTVIRFGWKMDQYLPGGVGLQGLSPYPSDYPQGLLVNVWVIYCAGGQTRPLKFVKRVGQRCVPVESTHQSFFLNMQRMYIRTKGCVYISLWKFLNDFVMD